MFKAGLHVPVILLSDVVGNGAKTAPEQIGPIALKAGLIPPLTVIVRLVVVAHCPAAGVNVYVVVAVLFKAGLQVPVMLLSDVVGKGAKTPPGQIGATGSKVGVTPGVTVMVRLVVVAHCPAAGVKV